MTYFELALCQKMGKIFTLAVSEYHLNKDDFIENFLKSNTFSNICDGDCTLISQGRYYILNKFLDEITLKQEQDGTNEYDEDAMFWLGYLIMYWCISENISGALILSNYNLKKIYEYYDILHSLKVSVAIDDIKKNFTLPAASSTTDEETKPYEYY